MLIRLDQQPLTPAQPCSKPNCGHTHRNGSVRPADRQDTYTPTPASHNRPAPQTYSPSGKMANASFRGTAADYAPIAQESPSQGKEAANVVGKADSGHHEHTGTVQASAAHTHGIDEKTAKRMGLVECTACKTRTYCCGSNDPGISFSTPTQIDPGQAASAVMSHEQEHLSEHYSQAREKGMKVVSQGITITTAVCPECGKVYVSGGEARTVAVAAGSHAPEPTPDGNGSLLDREA